MAQRCTLLKLSSSAALVSYNCSSNGLDSVDVLTKYPANQLAWDASCLVLI